jgi:gamma-glutamyltranspeptidase/glutathione hydrolase
MTRVDALHYYLEASRYSFADRNAYLADPDYFAVPLTGCCRRTTRRRAAR